MSEFNASNHAEFVAAIQKLYREQRYETVVRLIGNVREGVEDLPLIHYYEGLSLSELGRREDAFQALERASKMFERGNAEEHFLKLVYYHAGAQLKSLGDPEAEAWFERIAPRGEVYISDSFEIYHGFLRTVMTGPGPRTVQVEPTNHCNLDCIMCSRRLMSRPLGLMDMDLYERLAREAGALGTRFIRLFYLGEPFIHKGIGEMVRIAKAAGVEPLITCNGLVFNEKLFRDVLSHSPVSITVSVDGDSAESYERIRLKSDYEKLVRNVRRMVEIRNELQTHTRLEVHAIHDPAGSAERRQAFEGFWMGIVDSFVWMAPTDFGEGVEFVNGNGDLTSVASIEHGEEMEVCKYPLQELVIDWRGYTVPCCYDHNFIQKIGRFGEKSLREMWNGPTMRELRKMAVNGTYYKFPVCSVCNCIKKELRQAPPAGEMTCCPIIPPGLADATETPHTVTANEIETLLG